MTVSPPAGSEPVARRSARPVRPAWQLVVDRADLGRRVVRDLVPADLADGEVRLRVDAFAVTANNLTYAVTGDRFGYWDLFPVGEGWGIVPAWGIATVEDSTCPEVLAGERFTGMVPMATHFTAHPRSTRDGFADRAAHRAAVDPVYNRYVRAGGRDDDDLEREVALRPVFVLSFVLAEHLRAAAWRGARRLVVTAASSKASLGLAHVLNPDDVTVVGLTSAVHRAEVDAVGVFDDVVTYDHLDDLVDDEPSVLVDVVGDPGLRATVTRRLGASLLDTVRVGQTDWDRPAAEVLGHDDTAFFAPTVIRDLVADWGAATFARRLDEAMQSFVARTHLWLNADHRDGRTGVARAFDDVAAGRVHPHRFVIVRPRHAAR